MRCVAPLALQHWQLLIVGAEHGSGAAGRSLKRILDSFRPAVIFLELDKADFARFAPLWASESHSSDNVELALELSPECATAVQWAAGVKGARPCAVVPMDRAQRTTRRRLACRLAQQPLELLRARRYWGALPAMDQEAVAQWRQQLQSDAPSMHEVLFDERDEYMAYQILLHLDSRLATCYAFSSHSSSCLSARLRQKQASTASGVSAAEEAEWIDSRLQHIATTSTAEIGAALRWALDGPSPGDGGIWAHQEWCMKLQRPLEPPASENVVVVCGPAHVEGLAHRLDEYIGGCRDDDGGKALRRHFLARNAAILPHLLVNSDWHWSRLRREADSSFLLQRTADMARTEETANAGVKPTVQTTWAFGPLTLLALRVWNWLPVASGESLQQTVQNSVAKSRPRASPVVVQERLRDLSHRPLPVWPMFLVVYVVCPLMVCVVIPAQIDIHVLRAKFMGPAHL
mmetsp:Transcript_123056/g.244948  ORF Transcript_123056/g.244948 Transcript_123056/m.244948 type:complete len:460 (+) Transcript_123056:51-1430(+)